MSIEEYKTLQIGMYVTDSKKAKVSLVCSDFYLIKEFKKGGIVLQPLWSDGHINSEETPFWAHYSNIDLTHKLHPSTFRETIAIG